MNYTKAIVRPPGDRYRYCISSHPLVSSLDLSKARKQHHQYCTLLEDLGIELIRLPANHQYPDSCFVEDTVVVHNTKAFITRMAEDSRRGEENAIESILKDYFIIERAVHPATIEGGDVIHLDNRFISGITQRTNDYGVKQMKSFFDIPITTIKNKAIVHLKSYMTYLGDNTMIVANDFTKHEQIKNFDIIVPEPEEEYVANTLTINDTVIMSNKAVKTRKKVEKAGFNVKLLDVSEFEKCEGALTCLSILF